jgi:hypothetical protein
VAVTITPHEVLTVLTSLVGAMLWALRLLWRIRGSWDDSNARLEALIAKVADLITLKEADHTRLDRRDQEIAERLDRHLDWHDKH